MVGRLLEVCSLTAQHTYTANLTVKLVPWYLLKSGRTCWHGAWKHLGPVAQNKSPVYGHEINAGMQTMEDSCSKTMLTEIGLC